MTIPIPNDISTKAVTKDDQDGLVQLLNRELVPRAREMRHWINAHADKVGASTAPGQVTAFGAANFDATAPGVYALVPAPPAGSLRVAVCLSGGPVSAGWTLFSSDSSIGANGLMATGVGTFDAQLQLGGAGFGAMATGLAEFSGAAGSPLRPGFTLITGPGEDVAINIVAFHGGCNRVFGAASWYDIPADGCTIVRQALSTATIDLMAAVPTGKVAVILDAISTETNYWDDTSSRFFLEQLDSLLHSARIIRNDGGGKAREVQATIYSGFFSPGGLNARDHPMHPLPAGSKLQAFLQEAVATTAPKIHFVYKLVDALP